MASVERACPAMAIGVPAFTRKEALRRRKRNAATSVRQRERRWGLDAVSAEAPNAADAETPRGVAAMGSGIIDSVDEEGVPAAIAVMEAESEGFIERIDSISVSMVWSWSDAAVHAVPTSLWLREEPPHPPLLEPSSTSICARTLARRTSTEEICSSSMAVGGLTLGRRCSWPEGDLEAVGLPLPARVLGGRSPS